MTSSSRQNWKNASSKLVSVSPRVDWRWRITRLTKSARVFLRDRLVLGAWVEAGIVGEREALQRFPAREANRRHIWVMACRPQRVGCLAEPSDRIGVDSGGGGIDVLTDPRGELLGRLVLALVILVESVPFGCERHHEAASLRWLANVQVTFGPELLEIGRRRVGKECRSRWAPYH